MERDVCCLKLVVENVKMLLYLLFWNLFVFFLVKKLKIFLDLIFFVINIFLGGFYILL